MRRERVKYPIPRIHNGKAVADSAKYEVRVKKQLVVRVEGK